MNFFGKVFNGIGHAVAWIFKKAFPFVETVAQDAATAANSPIGVLVAGAFGRTGQEVRDDIDAIAGSVLAARNALGDAFAAKAGDLGLDQKALQAVEALYADLSKLLAGQQPSAPAPSAQAQP